MRSELSAADLLRALHALRPTDAATKRAIAELLLPRPSGGREVPAAADALASPPDPHEPHPLATEAENGDAGSEPSLGLAMDSVLQALPPESMPGPPRTAELERPRVSEEHVPELPFAPLLAPRWTRGILTAALATRAPHDGAPLDLERIVEAVARGEVLERLPRVPSWALPPTVQVLADRGAGMAPFERDQRHLARVLRRVAGADRVTERPFVGCPDRDDEDEDEESYTPPPAGSVVVLLSDLGIARPRQWRDRAGVAEWRRFARRAREAGCGLVALVPYPADRWPSALTRSIRTIEWDRRTTATSIRTRSSVPVDGHEP